MSNITYRAFGMKQMSYSNAKTLSVGYDNRMRVTSWNVPGALGWNYAYNYFGENTGRATFAGNLTSGHTNNRHGVAYDAAGNLVDGTWYTFSYDATGQQTRATLTTAD